jgi:hypothetical protein
VPHGRSLEGTAGRAREDRFCSTLNGQVRADLNEPSSTAGDC